MNELTRRTALGVTAALGAVVASRSTVLLADDAKEGEKSGWDRATTGTDCVCNETNTTLRIHITSGHGHVEMLVDPGQCGFFNFVDDQKPRVLSAFSYPNELVAHFEFTCLNQPTVPPFNCLHISHNQKDARRKKEEQSHTKRGGNAAV